ncbi:hypothetical protein [Niveispirillum sp. KHB5.9]|uniref:hypothetical protein n=1 Tax=Niveispirillum sp. KHB5.9 TaxID=3400269 RepID=UPI003A84FBC0
MTDNSDNSDNPPKTSGLGPRQSTVLPGKRLLGDHLPGAKRIFAKDLPPIGLPNASRLQSPMVSPGIGLSRHDRVTVTQEPKSNVTQEPKSNEDLAMTQLSGPKKIPPRNPPRKHVDAEKERERKFLELLGLETLPEEFTRPAYHTKYLDDPTPHVAPKDNPAATSAKEAPGKRIVKENRELKGVQRIPRPNTRLPLPSRQKEATAKAHLKTDRSLLCGPDKITPSMNKNDWTELYKTSLCTLAARGWPAWLIRCAAEMWACHSFPHGLPGEDIDALVAQAIEVVRIVDCRQITEPDSANFKALSHPERLASLERFAQVALMMKCKPWMVRAMTRAEAVFRFDDSTLREDVEFMLDEVLNRPA